MTGFDRLGEPGVVHEGADSRAGVVREMATKPAMGVGEPGEEPAPARGRAIEVEQVQCAAGGEDSPDLAERALLLW